MPAWAWGRRADGNPVTNALFTTPLHAVGKPRDTFNRSASATEDAVAYGPLPELLAS